jgi:hypothetical protein
MFLKDGYMSKLFTFFLTVEEGPNLILTFVDFKLSQYHLLKS